jgi:DNA repair photolyase
MYDWVTHMWSPIRGCPHQCSYCYVRSRSALPEESTLRPEPWPNLGSGRGAPRTIFVGHLCDMWAEQVEREHILKVLEYCRRWPGNTYVFQTKNPERFLDFADVLPQQRIVGTTIETNRAELLGRISKAPPPSKRAAALCLATRAQEKFVTVEPILDFDVVPLAELIALASPDFVNIGADSKGHGLPEPKFDKVLSLIGALSARGIPIRKKMNLERLRRRA